MLRAERSAPVVMDRVAVVAPAEREREVLSAVADAGMVEVERAAPAARGPAAERWERCRRRTAHGGSQQPVPVQPRLVPGAPDLDALEAEARLGELAGEAELERVRAGALHGAGASAVVGWCPRASVDPLSGRIARLGGGLVRLPRPAGSVPPTLLRGGRAGAAFQPLVDTYGVVPYEDVNPSALVGVLYVVMFGMMFGDAGQGAVLVGAGLLVRAGRPRALRPVSHLWPFVVGAGAASMAFGAVYGEAFGPTGVLHPLWLDPVERATTLLTAAVIAGGVFLLTSFGLGALNRWREGGWRAALFSTSGVAGAALYTGLGTAGLALIAHRPAVAAAGAALASLGALLAGLGLWADAGGRAAGALQAAIELVDATIRLGSNTVSFARLAAFGLTHAALCGIVWSATTSLWHAGGVARPAAAAVFIVGNAVTFALEGLVAAVQALRLEYYELFSRVFTREGRRFQPWHVPLVAEEVPCSTGS